MRVPEEERARRERGELIAVHVDREERELLIAADPETFFITPHRRTSPSVLVWLASANEKQVRDLLVDAWRMRAPKRLVRELDDRRPAASA